ncbi:MAG: CTP synthase [Clostridia bacterium]|nr:CTP synthase [Clostridia bacterium]
MSTKFVFVTGGVVSSLGKGITAASLGRLLKARGFHISMQKCDPYYNVDPGLLSPLQHGEAFITDDGIAADLDLGHYERFIDESLHGEASTTTGKVHKKIMERELAGEYHGGTVQVVPHVTNEIKSRILSAAQNSGADIAIIEIGGTVGDMESSPYMEAIRQLRWELGDHSTCFIHVTLLPYISAAGEMKTKPTQHSVKMLRSIGIQPDVIVCRTEKPISEDAKEKIAMFCNVKASNVVQNADCSSIYEVPLLLEAEGLGDIVCDVLSLPKHKADLADWKELVDNLHHPKHSLRIALVGKYVALHDAYLSVSEALKHAGIANRCDTKISWILSDDLTEDNVSDLASYDGILIPGGFGNRGAEGIILAARFAREHGKPCLMIGYGMQLAVVEAVRHLLGKAEANSTEVCHSCAVPVVSIPEDRIGVNDSRQNSRQGGFDIALRPGRIHDLYGTDMIRERHGNRYEVNQAFVQPLEEKGFHFTAFCENGQYPEAFEMESHPFYIGVIYHPEYISRPNHPHPLFRGFVETCLAQHQDKE